MEDYCKTCDWKSCEKFKQTYDSTMRRIGEIRARYQAASKGPWTACRDGSVGGKTHVCHCKTASDAEFIAHAREDLPDCLDKIEWVYGVLEDIQCQLDMYGGDEGITTAFQEREKFRRALDMIQNDFGNLMGNSSVEHYLKKAEKEMGEI